MFESVARASGDYVEVQTVSGGDHFVVIDPSSKAWADVVEWLALLFVEGCTLPQGGLGSP